ncbi:hypothetical protein M406DRAFT_334183 [Cryphonectria parasitica EP155]|uniref:Uncharacterized protein n=1 Tax=Cryphonectria parasitica (strain ATCC 38755 / EP155) TaxID=660469 RepID=A0A9P5CKA5_CRYP1|nr:uncharacterized protein M406DRAFT_334183 [Cryphonectria parasitica EP155]KAF3760550.1 hypothetical protein M406DRAFT_334183 [Cryphonectria parasitica EP155]
MAVWALRVLSALIVIILASLQLARPNSQPETLKNDNAMWRQFVFGEVNEHLEQVLADARTRAARKLRPSDPFTSTDEICQSDEAHALGNLSPETSPSLKYSLAIDAQNIAEQTCSNTTIHTDQATVGSSAPSKPSLTASSDTMDKPPRRSDIWDMPTSDSENASLRSRPRPLQNHGEGDEGFRFSRPRPFIGKKTSHLDEGRQIALSLGQIRGKTVTRRRQKRSGNTRTDIRKLPNFNSDPIEEVEEHASRQRNEEPSLFGPLDMEENA